METAKKIALVAVFGLLAFAMTGAGATKLMADPMHVESFANWGYPSWFMYLTGGLEVLTAGLLLPKVTRFYGALLAGAIMFGAFGTHVINGELGGLVAPLMLGAFAAITAATNVPVGQGASTGTPSVA